MTPIIDGYRRVILHGQPPDLRALAVATVITLVLLAVGYVFFKRAEGTFADVI